MKPASFEYFNPTTVDDAVKLLGQYGEDDGKILAGGQSLVPLMNFRLARPKYLIDINGISSLDYIKEEGDWLAIGALTRERDVEVSPVVLKHNPLLAKATSYVGHQTIRNRGTVGGTIAHNDPTGEYALTAMLQGVEVVAQGPNGTRTVPIEDFFLTYLTTSLEANELVTEVRFPKMAANVGWSFQEFARRHGDYAVVDAAAMLWMDGKVVKDARIAIGACGPIAFRATDAEDMLKGQTLTDELIEQASAKAAAAGEPESDIHASAEYRTHLAGVLTKRALKEAQTSAS